MDHYKLNVGYTKKTQRRLLARNVQCTYYTYYNCNVQCTYSTYYNCNVQCTYSTYYNCNVQCTYSTYYNCNVQCTYKTKKCTIHIDIHIEASSNIYSAHKLHQVTTVYMSHFKVILPLQSYIHISELFPTFPEVNLTCFNTV